jgi:hypothetical protein
VLDERNGTWDQAIPLPGLRTINVDDDATLDASTCTGDETCRIVGSYEGSGAITAPYTDEEIHGVWQVATEIPNFQLFDIGGDPTFSSLTCETISSCVAQGTDTDSDRSFSAKLFKGFWHLGWD